MKRINFDHYNVAIDSGAFSTKLRKAFLMAYKRRDPIVALSLLRIARAAGIYIAPSMFAQCIDTVVSVAPKSVNKPESAVLLYVAMREVKFDCATIDAAFRNMHKSVRPQPAAILQGIELLARKHGTYAIIIDEDDIKKIKAALFARELMASTQ